MARIWDRSADGRTDRRSDAKDAPGISNENSVNFDGTDDYMSTGGADDTKKDRTYTFWAKSTNTASAAKSTVFSHGSTKHGAFHFNWGSDLPLLYLGDSYWLKWNDTSSQDDSAWHFWAVVMDVDTVTSSLLYMDGALQTANSYQAGGTATGWNTLDIGRSTTEEFQGNLDEFCVFDGHLTAAEILTLWNNGIPTSPIGVAPGQLEHWWRMGDDGGTGTFIPDHANLGLGAELITNGTFDSDLSGWTLVAGTTNAVGGEAVFINDSGVNPTVLYQAVTTVVGDVYRVSCDFDGGTGDSLRISADGTLRIMGNTTDSGTYVAYFRATTTATNFYIYAYMASIGETSKVDNVSLKQVNGNPGILESGASIQTDSP